MSASRLSLRTDRRGGIGLLVALMLPALLAAGALLLDGGLWLIERARLQIAADAAASAASAPVSLVVPLPGVASPLVPRATCTARIQ